MKSKLYLQSNNGDQKILSEMYKNKATAVHNGKRKIIEYVKRLEHNGKYQVDAVTDNGSLIINAINYKDNKYEGIILWTHADKLWTDYNLEYSERLERDKKIFAELEKNPEKIYL